MMNRFLFLTSAIFLLFVCSSFGSEFQGVEYVAPAGWKLESTGNAMGFVPNDVTPETGTVVVLGPAENLNAMALDVWLKSQLEDELKDGSSVLQESDIQKQVQGNVTTATLARVIQDPQGVATIRVYHAVTDGKKVALAMAMSVSQAAAENYQSAIRSFFLSLHIAGSQQVTPAAPQSEAKGEIVPDAAVVNGVPQGIFVGRSLLTGKAVCLMFLSGGRITRAIPAAGLNQFDWAQHLAQHPGDCGTWEIRGNQLLIRWGDGGVHEGPLTVTATGIEFYGKKYTRPEQVSVSAIAGKWESSRGTALWGGEGLMMTNILVIASDGSYEWQGATGGTVSGKSTYNHTRNVHGKLEIKGATMTFYGQDRQVESYTFLPLPDHPVVAFTLGSNLFTRTE